MSDSISRSAAIHAVCAFAILRYKASPEDLDAIGAVLNALPSAQPERLRDDDFEAIRIHLNAYKERLCNQHRWEEAEEYQRIINRFMSFASAQPERKTARI